MAAKHDRILNALGGGESEGETKLPAKFDDPGAMEAVFDKVKGEQFADKGRVPIYKLREEVRKQYGDAAASPEMFDEAMHDLRRAGKLRLIPHDAIAGSRHPSWDAISETPNEQQVKDSIPSPSGVLSQAEWVGSGTDENGLSIPKPSHGPSKPADGTHVQAMASKDHVPDLEAMKPGESAVVGGYPVVRNADGSFAHQIGGKKTFKTGDAQQTAETIRKGWESNKWQASRIQKALDRGDAHQPGNPFDSSSRDRAAAEEAKAEALPDGVEGVSLADATRGRVGVVKRDETGRPVLKFDDTPDEYSSSHFEPIDEKNSWRTADLEPPKKVGGAKTVSMFDTPAPDEPTPDVKPDPMQHANTPEAAQLDALAGGATPRKELQKTHVNLQKYQDLVKNGYTISHWLNPKNPDDQVLEYNLTSGEGRVSGRPRLTARNEGEIQAIHDALGVPMPAPRVTDPAVNPPMPSEQGGGIGTEVTPQDGWKNNLFKTRSYALDLMKAGILPESAELSADWRDKEKLVGHIERATATASPMAGQAAASPAKPPHEQTQADYLPGHTFGGTNPTTIADQRAALETAKQNTPHTADVQAEHLAKLEGQAKEAHKTAVALAIARGDTVSPEVMKDYPELAPKQKEMDPKPTQPQTETAKANPHLSLAEHLADKFRSGQQVTSKDLFAAANQHHGGTRAQGKYGPSDAYDSMETGLNLSLKGETDPRADLAGAQQQARELAEKVKQLPTQTNRSGNKDSYQQFSTPPHYSFAAAWVAGLKPGEHVLEPSAGTGSLAVQALNAGARVTANELDPRRADLLKSMVGPENVHTENAEQISGILPGKGVDQPTTVLMNPPFSQTAGRMGNKKELLTGAKHIEEAASMLPEGGRAVAIVGRGMTPESPTYKKWFDDMAKKGLTLRANVGVEGDEYKKYGTGFGTRLLVFDKAPPTGTPPVVGDAADIPDLMGKLEGVRNDRPQIGTAPPDQRVGDGLPAAVTDQARPDATGTPAVAGGVSAGAPGAAGGPVGAVAGNGVKTPIGAGGSDGTSVVEPGRVRRGRRAKTGERVADPVAAPGQADAGTAGGGQPGGGGETPGGQPGSGGSVRVPQLRPAAPVTLKAAAPPSGESKAEAVKADSPGGAEPVQKPTDSGGEDSLYQNYRPALLRVEGSQPHPSPLVESAAMSAVKPPVPTYQPHLSPDLVAMKEMELTDENGKKYKTNIGLSEAGLESVVYAGQAHQKMLPAAEGETPMRRGYFVGDGTGAGKGRQIAGTIVDNWNQGRKKHVWVSQKQTLYQDAHRDWREMGMDPEQMHHFDDIRGAAKPPGDGVAFITYDTLKDKPDDVTQPSNLEQLGAWMGKDFDGVIAFDEAHAMGNAMGKKGPRGDTEASARAKAGVQFQRMFPNARVMYVSATGATEVANLAYAERLGLWGRGTAFPTKEAFVSQMEDGGVAAMESVAQSMKAMGSYGARSLSFDDGTPNGKVTYDRLTHQLTDEQKQIYDTAAEGWQTVLKNVDKALELTGGAKHRNAKGAAMSQFQASQQQFFNQIMTSMQVPSVIKSMEQDLKEGRSPVIQLVSTMEEATKREVAKKKAAGESMEFLDVSPKSILMNYLEKSFPVHRFEEFEDEDGNKGMRPVKDSEGNHVTDPKAVALREQMLDRMGELPPVESALDHIIRHFGHENVAEATGRKMRPVHKENEQGQMERVIERRNPKVANISEADAFQAGKKKIMIFSDAGGTGRSYHADKKAGNQQQRVHYMLQPGWRADNAVQGLGRTHRTNQVIAPTYRLVEIEQLKAQKRFISTIARRLDQLGALTKGQRQAGGGGLFKAADNLESTEANDALDLFFRDSKSGRIPGIDHNELMSQLGYASEDDDKKAGRRGRPKDLETPPMSQFLNRLLSLKVDMQGKVYDAFEQRLNTTVERAMANGTLDAGVENFKADKLKKVEDTPVYKDPETGAEARLIKTIASRKTEKVPFEHTQKGEKPSHYVRNRRSGRVRAVYPAGTITDSNTGAVVPHSALRGPGWRGNQKFEPSAHVTGDKYDSRYEKITPEEAKTAWDEEHKAIPDFEDTEEHFLTGAILPIWDRIPGGKARVFRIKTSDGEQAVGRHVPAERVNEMMTRLGVSTGQKQHEPADVHAKIAAGSHMAKLANGWQLKPVRVGGERRIEIDPARGPSVMVAGNELRGDGAISERVGYDTRYFIPTGPDGAKVLERITKARPVVEVGSMARSKDD